MSNISVTVSGLTGTGKSYVAGIIELALQAAGINVHWVEGTTIKDALPPLLPSDFDDIMVEIKEVNEPRSPMDLNTEMRFEPFSY